MDLQVHKDAVTPIFLKKGDKDKKDQGISYASIWQMLYYIKLLRYVTNPQLKKIKSSFSKICAVKNLRALCESGYLREGNEGVFIATYYTESILKLVGYNIDLLPPRRKGNGDINELLIVDELIKILKTEPIMKRQWKTHTQHALFYPQYPKENPYIKPDALLAFQKNGKYRLEFLEVEAKKPYWEDYLYKKEKNYKRLAQDMQVYNYWVKQAELLNLPQPEVGDFCFTIRCISDGKLDFNWEGWEFE